MVTDLHEQAVIAEDVFSLWLTKDTDSMIWFGGYDLDYVKKGLATVKWQWELALYEEADYEKEI